MATRDPNCLFCSIAAGEIPTDVVERTDRIVLFRDINPQAPTHVLAIPVEHIASADHLTEAEDAVVIELFGAMARIAKQEGLGGHRIVTNVGRDAGQSVDHLHFHLLGGRPLHWPPG